MKHLTRCLVAGIVALLPIFGLILVVVGFEYSLAGQWLKDRPFYFPGLGILLALGLLYVVGLLVTTVFGRWIWRRVDRLLSAIPGFGQIFDTLKQVLGYGEGEDALFLDVVLVDCSDNGGQQLGLVTRRLDADHDSPERLAVFLPTAPNPAVGRLILIESSKVQKIDAEVHDVMKLLVSLGKTDLQVD